MAKTTSQTLIPLLLLLLSPLSTTASSAAYPTIPGTTDTSVFSSSPFDDLNLIPARREVYGDGRIFDISHKYTSDKPAHELENGMRRVIRLNESMKNGSLANMSELKISVHCGTHVDAPGHYIDRYFDAGFDVDSLDLEVLNGPGLLIDVPRDTNITAGVMKSLNIPKGTRRVLFRTLNTDRQLMFKNQFDTSFVGFTEDGAKWLAENTDIKLVGIDYLAVAAWDYLVSAHVAFLEKRDIIIVEGLKLDNVKAGIYSIHCLPLRLVDAEGSPARCILIK
ncbi:Cyclase family protein [Euphorbia peplus]|nr:Cyclase family protein [Euphorbia peplus]